jgi:hypothetical protein
MTAAGADFLSQLAAKAVGAAPLVEPRLPSLFESGLAERALPIEEVAEVPAAALVRSAASLRQPPEERPVQAERPRGALQAPEPSAPQQPPTPRLEVRAAQAEPDAVPALVAQPLLRPAAAQAPEPPAVVARRERPEAETPSLPSRQASREPVEAPSLVPLPTHAARPEPAVEAARNLVVQLRDPAQAPVVRAEQQPPATPLLRPAPLPASVPPLVRGRERAAAEAEPPAPVVNITIGRVEIRAAVAAPPAKPRPAPQRQAPQALADYLKARSGGR